MNQETKLQRCGNIFFVWWLVDKNHNLKASNESWSQLTWLLCPYFLLSQDILKISTVLLGTLKTTQTVTTKKIIKTTLKNTNPVPDSVGSYSPFLASAVLQGSSISAPIPDFLSVWGWVRLDTPAPYCSCKRFRAGRTDAPGRCTWIPALPRAGWSCSWGKEGLVETGHIKKN